MRLAKMLALYLAASDMTQKQAAQEIGVGESTLSRFLNEKQMPDAEAFVRIQMWCLGFEPAPTPDIAARVSAVETRLDTLAKRAGPAISAAMRF